ncbi:MAG: UDP-N-acetylmuramate dehydrogenase [Anaerolineaceae bacterium]
MNMSSIHKLEELFGDRFQQNVRMANYTTSRVGGLVLGLLPANTLDDLRHASETFWKLEVPFKVIGSGANILVSDKGYEGVILLNRCHNIKIFSQEDTPFIYTESGANFGAMARQTALRGLTGLEWANSIPGTVGGAVYGNAGAHGWDVARALISTRIFFKDSGEHELSAEDMAYTYRSSVLKREHTLAVILSATFTAQKSTREKAWAKLNEFAAQRQATQPGGASTGSTFKNPVDDYAGRLIEAAGLKGHTEGHACFSSLHANFIVNDGTANAHEYYTLIKLAQKRVKDLFGIDLELEIELLGDFND